MTSRSTPRCSFSARPISRARLTRLGLDPGMSWSCYDPYARRPGPAACATVPIRAARTRDLPRPGLIDPTRYAAGEEEDVDAR